jgi:hypothetical protein
VFLALMAPTVAPVEIRSTGDAGLLPVTPAGVLAVAIFGVFLFLVRRRRGRRK